MKETYDKFELTALADPSSQQHSTNPFWSDSEDIASTSNDNDDTTVDSKDPAVSLEYQMERIIELKQQNKLRDNIQISGIPIMINENLNEIFDKICHIIHSDITTNDIVAVYRNAPARFVVQFVSFQKKARFLRDYKSCGKSHLMSGQIIETESIESQNQVFIESHLTKWYVIMMRRASAAKKDGLIFKYWLSSNGLAVMKSSNAIPDHCLSVQDIEHIIYDS